MEREQPMSAEQPLRPLVLRLLSGPQAGGLLKVRDGVCVIGADPTATLRLRAPGVAPRHCEIRREGTEVLLTALEAPVTVNGAEFQSGILRQGDRIEVGPLALEHYEPSEPTLPGQPGAPQTAAPVHSAYRSAAGEMSDGSVFAGLAERLPGGALGAVPSLALGRQELRRASNRRTRNLLAKLKQTQHDVRLERSRTQSLEGQQARHAKQMLALEQGLAQLREQSLTQRQELERRIQEQAALVATCQQLREESQANQENLRKQQAEHQQKLQLLAAEYAARQEDFTRISAENQSLRSEQNRSAQALQQAERDAELAQDALARERHQFQQELAQLKHSLSLERQGLESERQELLEEARRARNEAVQAESIRGELTASQATLASQTEALQQAQAAAEALRQQTEHLQADLALAQQNRSDELTRREQTLAGQLQEIEQLRSALRSERFQAERRLEGEREELARRMAELQEEQAGLQDRELAVREQELQWARNLASLEAAPAALLGPGADPSDGERSALQQERAALALARAELDRERSQWLAEQQDRQQRSQEVSGQSGLTLEWSGFEEEVAGPGSTDHAEALAEWEARYQASEQTRQELEVLLAKLQSELKLLQQTMQDQLPAVAAAEFDGPSLEELQAGRAALERERKSLDQQNAAAVVHLNQLNLELNEKRRELEDVDALLEHARSAMTVERERRAQWMTGEGAESSHPINSEMAEDFKRRVEEWEQHKQEQELELRRQSAELTQLREELEASAAELLKHQELLHTEQSRSEQNGERSEPAAESPLPAPWNPNAFPAEEDASAFRDLRLPAEPEVEPAVPPVSERSPAKYDADADEDVTPTGCRTTLSRRTRLNLSWDNEDDSQQDDEANEVEVDAVSSARRVLSEQVPGDANETNLRAGLVDTSSDSHASEEEQVLPESNENEEDGERLRQVLNEGLAEAWRDSKQDGELEYQAEAASEEGEEQAPGESAEDYFDRAARALRAREQQRAGYEPPDLMATLRAMQMKVEDVQEEEAPELEEPRNSMHGAGAGGTGHSDESDDSVKEYMQRLLERSAPKGTVPAETTPTEHATETRDTADRPKRAYLRRAAPELGASLAAMRQIANQTSIDALQTHAYRTARNGIITKAILAGFCGVGAVVMCIYVRGWIRFVGAGMALGISAYSVQDLWMLMRKLKAIREAASNKALRRDDLESASTETLHTDDALLLHGLAPEDGMDGNESSLREHGGLPATNSGFSMVGSTVADGHKA